MRSTLSFKTVAEREGCVVLEAPCQHREAMSHTSSQVGAPLLQRNWGSFSENSRTARVRCGHCEDQQPHGQQVVPAATRHEH